MVDISLWYKKFLGKLAPYPFTFPQLQSNVRVLAKLAAVLAARSSPVDKRPAEFHI